MTNVSNPIRGELLYPPRIGEDFTMIEQPKTFDDVLAEGSARAEERASSGITPPLRHRRGRMTWKRFLAHVRDAYNETRMRWGYHD